MPTSYPKFVLGQTKIGKTTLSVIVSWGPGLEEEISGFPNEREAQDWIDTKSKAWAEERLKRKPDA
jgi:hypothetical protein